MDVGKYVLANVPTSVADIQSSNKCQFIVNDYKFFVMRPPKDHVAYIFEDIMVRMSKDVNVAVTWLSFWAELVENVFCVSRIACQGLSHLLVDNHVDLHTSFGSALYDLIDTPFLIEVVWS